MAQAGGSLSADEVARRAGVDLDTVGRYTRLGILEPDGEAYSPSDVNRIRLARSCEEGGVPLDGVGEAIASGALSFGFMDMPQYRFAHLSDQTYAEVAAELRLPFEVVQRVNEALGLRVPSPEDRAREDDIALLRSLAFVLGWEQGEAVLRTTRVYGEALRRIAEAESTWYRERLERPMLDAGVPRGEVMRRASEFGAAYMQFMDGALLDLYHRQQELIWIDGIVLDIEEALEELGLYRRLERPPAMCFLDLTGYTRLTEERGDAAAAELAGGLAQIAQGASQHHGGRPVKWLGDGVMFWFRDPAEAVVASLEMVERVPEAGLPPAHVGLAAGPVIQQDGDYYGRTVNLAARISARAGPSEVLVTSEVADRASSERVRFEPVGAAELKGFSSPVSLHRAERAGR
jgi:class 3 adenylate cyclase/DNA-binding transcriptional MerR regulator